MSSHSFFSIEELSPLYEAVQTSGIFPDSKYFVDCVPLLSAENILAAYNKEKDSAGFDLTAFIKKHFRLPPESDNTYRSANKALPEHLDELWNLLTRQPDEQGGTLIPLPHPYIVPGGRFREIYYWDSYFTMLGLQVSKRVDIMENMINNFAYLINTVGFIPNGNRTYYLGRSQPPFFAMMLSLLAKEKGNAAILPYQKQLENEYAFWMKGAAELTESSTAKYHVVKMPDGSILNRYWDNYDHPRPEAYTEDTHIAKNSGRNAKEVYRHIRAAAESGWDFSSRWFRDQQNMETIQTADLIPVDLNCILCHTEVMLTFFYAATQQKDKEEQIRKQYLQRRKAIDTYCWNTEKGFYFDYHFKEAKQTDAYTLAAVFPLYVSIASGEQAKKVAEIIEQKFLQPGGLLTTLNTTGQQWDAPNGWAPLQWIAYKGLKQIPYGHSRLAEKIRQNWMRNNEKVYAATGKMMEKYNVSDTETNAGGGEYPNQDGFGWTNGVYLAMLADER